MTLVPVQNHRSAFVGGTQGSAAAGAALRTTQCLAASAKQSEASARINKAAKPNVCPDTFLPSLLEARSCPIAKRQPEGVPSRRAAQSAVVYFLSALTLDCNRASKSQTLSCHRQEVRQVSRATMLNHNTTAPEIVARRSNHGSAVR
jgi:hypothetical protein